MTVRQTRRLRWLLLVGLCAIPSALPAQIPPIPDHLVALMRTSSRCLDAIPASALQRVVVYGEAVMRDSTAQAFLPTADSFTMAVIERARMLLGAHGDSLPQAEPAYTWRGVGLGLLFTAYRDGRITWRTPPPDRDSTTAALLARAAAAVHADSPTLAWPADFQTDSAIFLISLAWPKVTRDGVDNRLRLRAPAPLFTVAMPWAEGVRVVRQPVVEYPEELTRAGISGYIILQFTVDTTGRVMPETISDIWPATQPPLDRELRRAYLKFVDAARRSLGRARFEPARTGGCAFPQVLKTPFSFDLQR
jgi:hypothetical protein